MANPSRSKAGEAGQKHDFLVKLIGTRDTWPDDMTPDEEKIMTEHYYFLKDLVRQGKCVLAGPCFDDKFGLIIFSDITESELKEIMNREPSVTNGLHTYEYGKMRVSLLKDFINKDSHVLKPDDRVLMKEIIVPADLAEVWRAWTTSEGMQEFLVREANIELRIGGPYELYFAYDSPPGQRGSETCKVLSYQPMKMLSFEWNAPPSFGDLRFRHTRVIVYFEEVNPGEIRVDLNHIGWGEGAEWDEVYDYFDKAWAYVLEALKKRFVEGPVKWTDEG